MKENMKKIVLGMNRVKLIIVVTILTICSALLTDLIISKIFGFEIVLEEMLIKVSLIPLVVVPAVGWYLLGLIYELDKLEKRMSALATYDDLTGLLNRRAFYSSAQSMADYCYRSKQPYSILLVDLDFFKKINDVYGHAGGDKVLASFGALSSETSRGSDVIGRLGGEEFAFLLPNTSLEQAKICAQRLREKINALEVKYEDKKIKYMISIGISSSSQLADEVDIDQLLAMADKALYSAKDKGRNQEVLYEVELATSK